MSSFFLILSYNIWDPTRYNQLKIYYNKLELSLEEAFLCTWSNTKKRYTLF